MNEQKLIDELRARAEHDAKAFRKQYRGDEPNERWLENSFTAALPLAKDAAGFSPGDAENPRFFTVYKDEVVRVLGMSSVREDSRRSDEQLQQPTRGEG